MSLSLIKYLTEEYSVYEDTVNGPPETAPLARSCFFAYIAQVPVPVPIAGQVMLLRTDILYLARFDTW